MKGLVKVAPIVIIIACLASLVFAFKIKGDKKNLLEAKQKTEQDLSSTRTKLTQTQGQLSTAVSEREKVQDELTAARTNLNTANVKLEEKTKEADGLAVAKKDLETQLGESQAKLTEAQAALEPLQAKLTVLQEQGVEALSQKVEAFTKENEMLAAKVRSLDEERTRLEEELQALGQTPPGTRGHVALSKEHWNFVVLDVGADEQVRANSNFLLYRDSKLIAKARVIVVNQNNSVAELLPGFTVGTPRAGDVAMSAPKEM